MLASTPKTDDQTPKLDIDEDELARLNQEMITSDLITPDRMLVDLILIKDFTISTLLSFLYEWKTSRPNMDRGILYTKIIDGLEAYQNREFDDIAQLFPLFGLTNSDINQRKSDPLWARYILHNAPLTPFLKTLRSQIAVNVNHSAVISKRDPIEITINTYPLKLSPIDTNIVGLYFSKSMGVHVKVICLDMTKISLTDALFYDEIYTYYFAEFLSNDDIRSGYEALKFIRKRLFVPRLFGPSAMGMMSAEQQEVTIKTRFDILTQFQFFPVKLCSAMEPETPESPKKDEDTTAASAS